MTRFRPIVSLALVLGCVAGPLCAQSATLSVSVAAHAPARPFPHFWEQMFGSGHAVLSLRDNYRRDLKEVHDQIGMRYVRFHGIFDDENGVYSEDAQGNPVYNWSYIDQIYDGLLAEGVWPFVEIGFMPKALAARPDVHAFCLEVSPLEEGDRAFSYG